MFSSVKSTFLALAAEKYHIHEHHWFQTWFQDEWRDIATASVMWYNVNICQKVKSQWSGKYLLVEVEVDLVELPGLWLADEERSCELLVIPSSSCPTSSPETPLSSALRRSDCAPPSCCPDTSFPSDPLSPVADSNAGSSPSATLSPPGIAVLRSHINANLPKYSDSNGLHMFKVKSGFHVVMINLCSLKLSSTWM